MGNHDAGHSNNRSIQPIVAFIGAVLAFVVVISFFMEPTKEVAPEPAAAVAAKIEENIKPVAAVEVAAVSDTHVEKSGEDVVKGGCAMCHATGMMESPKIGDAGQWAPRVAKGYQVLVTNAINGIRNMPARGGNPALTDNEIASAVAVMANQSGASFDPATLAQK